MTLVGEVHVAIEMVFVQNSLFVVPQPEKGNKKDISTYIPILDKASMHSFPSLTRSFSKVLQRVSSPKQNC